MNVKAFVLRNCTKRTNHVLAGKGFLLGKIKLNILLRY